MEFSRQEYWSGLPFPFPEILPTKGSNPQLVHLLYWQVDFFFMGWEDPLEKEMAIHSSILVWRIPWTEERLHFHFEVEVEGWCEA